MPWTRLMLAAALGALSACEDDAGTLRIEVGVRSVVDAPVSVLVATPDDPAAHSALIDDTHPFTELTISGPARVTLVETNSHPPIFTRLTVVDRVAPGDTIRLGFRPRFPTPALPPAVLHLAYPAAPGAVRHAFLTPCAVVEDAPSDRVVLEIPRGTDCPDTFPVVAFAFPPDDAIPRFVLLPAVTVSPDAATTVTVPNGWATTPTFELTVVNLGPIDHVVGRRRAALGPLASLELRTPILTPASGVAVVPIPWLSTTFSPSPAVVAATRPDAIGIQQVELGLGFGVVAITLDWSSHEHPWFSAPPTGGPTLSWSQIGTGTPDATLFLGTSVTPTETRSVTAFAPGFSSPSVSLSLPTAIPDRALLLSHSAFDGHAALRLAPESALAPLLDDQTRTMSITPASLDER